MLNNKQKKYLKTYAHSHDILKFNIGKELIDHNVVLNLKNALEKYEIIKISFLKSALDNKDMNELVIEISSLLNAEVLQKIGHTILIYKENKKSPLHINF